MNDVLSTTQGRLAAVLLLLLLVTIGYLIVQRWRHRPFSDGFFRLVWELLSRRKKIRGGTLWLSAAGTYGVRQLLRVLQRLAVSGYAHVVTGLVISELDNAEQEEFFAYVPDVFNDRVLVVDAELPGGNQDREGMLEAAEDYAAPAYSTMDQALLAHELRYPGVTPTTIVHLQSAGGQIDTGVPVVQVEHNAFPHTILLGVICQPRAAILQNNFPQSKPTYDAAGVSAWLYTDENRPNIEDLDDAGADLIAGMAGGSARARALGLNNLVARLAGKQRGALLEFQLASSAVLGAPDPKARDFVSPRQRVVAAARVALRKVASGAGLWSASLPIDPASSVIDVVITNSRPEDAAVVQQELRQYAAAHRRLVTSTKSTVSFPAWVLKRVEDTDEEMTVVSVGTRIDPAVPMNHVKVLRLQRAQANALSQQQSSRQQPPVKPTVVTQAQPTAEQQPATSPAIVAQAVDVEEAQASA